MSARYLWPYKCAASGCNSKGKDCRLFRFPKASGPSGKARVKKWLDCAQNTKVNTVHAYLCDLHFNDRQFRDADRTLLIYGAVPTIQLENGVYIETEIYPPEGTSFQLVSNPSVVHSKDTSGECHKNTSVEYPEKSSVQCPKDSSLEVSVQYPVNSSVYFTDDNSVQICLNKTTKNKWDSVESSAGAGFDDHMYARNSEPEKSQPCNGINMVQAGFNNSKKVNKASFTVYVITPKSDGTSAAALPVQKEKGKCPVKPTTNLEESCDADKFSERSKSDDFVCENSSVPDELHGIPHEMTFLPHLHSFTSCKQVTPRERKLILLVSKKVGSLRQIKRKYEEQKLTLKRLCSVNSELVRELEEFSRPMSLASVNFLASRVFCRKKRPKGRTWHIEDKVQALALYKRLPKCYILMTTIFALPSKKMLNNTLAKIPLLPGFNEHIFESLARRVSNMDVIDRTCILLFDEIPLEEYLKYDIRTDTIIGFEDWGHLGRRDKIGSHALVFVLKGLYRKWKQPVVFYFTAGSLSVELLRSVVQSCLRAGLNVVATVCNMTTNNTRLLKRLGSSEEKPFLHFGDSILITLYNPPQLLKSLRDMLFKYDVFVKHNLGGKVAESKASWSIIHKAYDLDSTQERFRLLQKLTDDHVDPRGQAAEKVIFAVQVLSHSMAAAICCYVSHGILNSSALATAHFAGFCNKLFDGINGKMFLSQGAVGIRQLSKATESKYLQFWDESIYELEQWKVMNASNEGNSLKHAEYFRPSCLSGWITTLRGMKLLWAKLKDIGFTCVDLRINLDLIQHLFASIQSHSGSRTYPTASQFVSSMKTLMLNGLVCIGEEELNCEERCNSIELLNNLWDLKVHSSKNLTSFQYNTFTWPNSNFSLAHTASYIAEKISNDGKCDHCKHALLAMTPDEYVCCGKIFGVDSDKCPSDGLLWCVAHAACVLEEALPDVAHENLVCSRVVSVVKERVTFDWLEKVCSLHAEYIWDTVLTTVCRALIPQWCTRRRSSHLLTNCVEIQLQFCKIKMPEHR